MISYYSEPPSVQSSTFSRLQGLLKSQFTRATPCDLYQMGQEGRERDAVYFDFVSQPSRAVVLFVRYVLTPHPTPPSMHLLNGNAGHQQRCKWGTCISESNRLADQGALHSRPGSPCRCASLPIEERPVALRKGQQRGKEYLSMNPLAKVPCLKVSRIPAHHLLG